MPELPDIAGLAHVSADDWLALHHRLAAIGVDAQGVAPILALCVQYPEDDRDPIRLWHLRRRSDDAALAMRLLMFGDALTVAESITALGESLHRLLAAAGLLQANGDAVRCVLRLGMAEDFYLFADDLAPGGAAVMGMRETTVPLWRAVSPARALGRALDLGCGAGAIALLLSRHAGLVVATDINPRAVALARINVALNATDNVDVREGDLFAPVAGETFDLIATHPPYIALPDGAPSVTNLHGGPRGDELGCRLLARLTPHLAPGGRAVVQAHWPLRQGETQVLRIRDAAGPDLDLLILRLGATGADELATFWGQQQQHSAWAVARIREHYARLGLVGTEASLSVLRLGSTTPGWTAALEVPPGSVPLITADRIDRLLRSCDLLHGTDAALLASRLRLPEGASLATIETPPGSGATRKILLPPPGTLRGALDVTPETELVLTAVHNAPTVAESGQGLAAVRAALALGMLEPVPA
jgi:methylase of polypeptide subunit release factors